MGVLLKRTGVQVQKTTIDIRLRREREEMLIRRVVIIGHDAHGHEGADE